MNILKLFFAKKEKIKQLKEENDQLKQQIQELDKRLQLLENTDNIVNSITNNTKYIDYVNSIIKSNLDTDKYAFNKKIQLSQMRATKSYDHVMKVVNIMMNEVVENYLIKKYKIQEAGMYKLDIYNNDVVDDLNKLYNIFITVASPELILDDLATFYNIYNINTKEFLTARFIAPVYNAKISQMQQLHTEYLDSIKMKPVDVEKLYGQYEKTDSEEMIDKLTNNNGEG